MADKITKSGVVSRYTGRERVWPYLELVERLQMAGFDVAWMEDVEGDGEGGNLAFDLDRKVIGLLEENEKNGSWEIITYSPESLKAFKDLGLEDLIVWAWGDDSEQVALLLLSCSRN